MSTPGQRARLQFVTIVVAAALLVVILWNAYGRWQSGAAWDPLRIAGLVLTLVAGSLLLTARIQLGNAVSFGAEANKLITTGLYSKFRNPVYLFGALTILGIALYAHSWPLVAALAIVAPMQFVRARNEAAVLEQAFGDEYRAYRAKTWF
ncbi:MAG TPA: isoprenylcysteine carboxylmethyltransferase family protein [Terriglobales bacterium]|nr:isoprenylcysteine carboxylmethyltransferase family protein [Terriglobales bacterium]